MRALVVSFSCLVLSACANAQSSTITMESQTVVLPRPQMNKPVVLVQQMQSINMLADGTHITSTTNQIFSRDSQGRTRVDQEFDSVFGQKGHTRAISVTDPVAGAILHWQAGLAPGSPQQYTRTPMHFRATPDSATTPPKVSPKHVTGNLPPSPSKVQSQYEDLGEQQVQGFACRASRSTMTFPVGFLGNDRPMVATQERCYSAEFGRELQGKNEDPRHGTHIVSTISISREEPDASLFQPPIGYTERVQTTR